MKNMRRSFIINRPFQFRFSLYVCSWLLALSFLYPWVIYDVFSAFFVYLSRLPNGPDPAGLQSFRVNTLWMLVISHAIFMGITFLISIFLSHRIAGPIFKLRQYMERVKSGDFNGVLFFRKHDHFQEMAAEFNEMVESMRTRLEKTETVLIEASTSADPETRKRIEKALDLVRKTSAS